MALLIVGLIIFLGVHSVRIVADDWRTAQIAKRGPKAWKGIYAVLSLIGFVLIVYGYGLARQTPAVLYATPAWLRHLGAVLTIPAFILIAAAYVPKRASSARSDIRWCRRQGLGGCASAGERNIGRRGPVRIDFWCGRCSTTPPRGGAIVRRERSMRSARCRAT